MDKLCKCGIKIQTPSEMITGKCVFCQGPADTAKANGSLSGLMELMRLGHPDKADAFIKEFMGENKSPHLDPNPV